MMNNDYAQAYADFNTANDKLDSTLQEFQLRYAPDPYDPSITKPIHKYSKRCKEDLKTMEENDTGYFGTLGSLKSVADAKDDYLKTIAHYDNAKKYGTYAGKDPDY